jgi:uncharacterized protein with HEPN domain
VIRSIEIIGEATKTSPTKSKQKQRRTLETDGRHARQTNPRLLRRDTKTLYKATKEDIPPLKALIEKILKEEKQ